MNDHFAANMTGKPLRFDVQPFERGHGIIRKVTPRRASMKDFDRRGRILVEYEVFDVEVEVVEGQRFGGFSCGVPISPARPTKGEMVTLSGLLYLDLWNAVDKGLTVVIARCG